MTSWKSEVPVVRGDMVEHYEFLSIVISKHIAFLGGVYILFVKQLELYLTALGSCNTIITILKRE